MKISLRSGFWAGAVMTVAATWMFLDAPTRAADPVPVIKTSATGASKSDAVSKVTKPGQINEEQLGNLLKAMGLEATKVDSRYDFQFKAIHNKEEWNLSMTAVLSQDGSAIWLMAWLDQLPKSSADVPRTALLRLLSDNDRLGNGKFFAYVATNRRFVLQRVVANEGVTTKVFRGWLDDLGGSVADSFDHWSVSAWKATDGSNSATAKTAPTATAKPQTAKADDDDDDDAGTSKPTTGPSFKGAGQNPIRTALPEKPGTSRK
ncbi:MAG: hypothetical protein IAG10_08330 [Planctomycetaceae bacterium]|nr:hypothetical protein [Planctomycetaceae bacterium]